MEVTSLWVTLQEASSQPDERKLALRTWLAEKVDLALYRPEAAPRVIFNRLTGREGEYYVLKNPETKTYFRLTIPDFYLWQRMDGIHTVKDLVVAYYLEYGSFAFGRVVTLVQQLRTALMLNDQPVNVYQRVRNQLERRRPGYRLGRVWHAFLQKPLAISGLDGFVGKVYRSGGWLLFTRPVQILFLAVSAVGFYAFAGALRAGGYGVVTIAGSLGLGIAGLIVANLLAIFLHEMAHALTVKHYKREVRRGGFMIYFGMPAFFVDTTDIWLESKRARLAVTWAGPYAGFILAGLVSIAINLWPTFSLNPLLFQFAFLSYLSVFFNLNPLLELDGYYLLMDWLEIPMLRRRSLDFIRAGLWDRLRTFKVFRISKVYASFSREEKIFAVFGLLSALWTAYAIYMGAFFWQRRLVGALRELWASGGDVAKTILALGTAALSLLFVLSIGLALLSIGRKVLIWAARRRLLANTWNVAAALLIVAVTLVLASAYLPYPAVPASISLMALAAATLFAWRSAVDYAGSRLAPVFWFLGLFSMTLFLSHVLGWVEGMYGMVPVNWQLQPPFPFKPIASGFGHLAYAFLFLGGLLLFADTNLRDLQPLEKVLMASGLTATYGLVLGLTRGSIATSNISDEALLTLTGSLVPLLVLTLLEPTLVSFWRTAFGPAWTALALSLGGLVIANLLDLSPLLAYLLLAGGLLLHHLAYGHITLLREQPKATLDLDDRQRLLRAFGWTVAAVLTQFRQIRGDRVARVLAERFNNYALAAGWGISLVREQVEDSEPRDLDLIGQGKVYAAALSLLVDMVVQEVGERLSVGTMQRAYDGLPWEEREIGDQYLFRAVERAEILNQEFQATQRDYRGLLGRIPLFATMDTADIELLCSCLRTERFAPRQAIIRQGQRGDRFYIIRRGHVEVTVRDEMGVSQVVNKLDRGDYFGEMALLKDAPRNATFCAAVPTEVLSLSRRSFERLVRSRFDMQERLDRSIVRADLLRQMPLFSEMDARQIQHIASQLQEETYEAGELLIQQGEIGKTFYVIETGQVQVSVAQEGTEQTVTERGPGEFVGEIALLLEVPRTASVRALTPTRVLALHKEGFDRLVAGHLSVGRGLERDMSRRMFDLQRATRQLSPA